MAIPIQHSCQIDSSASNFSLDGEETKSLRILEYPMIKHFLTYECGALR
jgi:hypothetical protein